jgi:superfamily II DNA helicase RecQ
MAYRTFVVPIYHATAAEQELNQFLASHQILAVEKRWLEDGGNSAWCFCVDFESASGAVEFKGTRVDYKEVLSPEDFKAFVRLRDLRRQVAEAEAVPVFAVFSNEQLAEMVRRRVRTPKELEAIPGVGESKVKKYGDRFLEALAAEGATASGAERSSTSASPGGAKGAAG